MSLKHAMEKYRSSEGCVLKIEYKGPIENTIQDFLCGLRSTATYDSTHNIEEFPDRTVFVPV